MKSVRRIFLKNYFGIIISVRNDHFGMIISFVDCRSDHFFFLLFFFEDVSLAAPTKSVLQCVAVRCRVVQCVAVWCSVLQCVAVSRTSSATLGAGGAMPALPASLLYNFPSSRGICRCMYVSKTGHLEYTKGERDRA